METLIRRDGLSRILELGFAHGVSTCYLAAVVDSLGSGRVTSIDLNSSIERNPAAEELLDRCGLTRHVELIRDISFTWTMMRWLEEDRGDRSFDLVYLDGGHTWDVTGYGFFLVDLFVEVGGWLVFDDIYWTHAGSPNIGDSERVKRMPKDYASTPQVERVFELLVKRHPSYGNFKIEQGWGYAQKTSDPRGRHRARRRARG